MACSSNLKRGFIPPQNDQERLVVRKAEDLYRIAHVRGSSRYSSFLSDREQLLAAAGLNRCGSQDFTFDGGYEQAERKLLKIEPAGACCEPPISCIKITCAAHAPAVGHKDYLGSLLGLGIDRSCLGDIVLFSQGTEQGAYVFCLHHTADLICMQLISVGRACVHAEIFEGELDPACTEHEIQTATVSSLRADAVIAAMAHCSRSRAAQFLSSGTVEINHIPASSSHSAVYEGDIFTIRGIGRFKLTALGGKSRKDRMFIEFFKY